MNRGRWRVAPFGAIALLALLMSAGCQQEESSKSAAKAHGQPVLSHAEMNKKKGEEFLAENAKKLGVKTTNDGLQYLVLKEGTGKTPKPDDTVVINFQGSTIDGKVFDNSFERKKPVTIKVKDMIPGWKEALLLMKEGSKWRLFIPSDLAYKQHGVRFKVGPNETVIFEIELLHVK